MKCIIIEVLFIYMWNIWFKLESSLSDAPNPTVHVLTKKLLSKFSFTEPHCFQVYISFKCSETNCEVFSLERKSRTWNFDIVLLWNENVIEISGCQFDYNLIKASEISCIFSSVLFLLFIQLRQKNSFLCLLLSLSLSVY